MPIELKMPALSPTMEEGTLAKWLKQEGDKVTSGDVIAEIETDKATMEYEAIDEGVIAKILVAEGTDEVKVGTVIAILIEEGEELPAAGAAPAPAPPRPPPEAAKPAPASPPHPRHPRTGSPRLRRQPCRGQGDRCRPASVAAPARCARAGPLPPRPAEATASRPRRSRAAWRAAGHRSFRPDRLGPRRADRQSRHRRRRRQAKPAAAPPQPAAAAPAPAATAPAPAAPRQPPPQPPFPPTSRRGR
jgi:pyruvate dehydrogenase E2 component (dihydrolipoamide acetyltransferase)